MKLKRFQRKSRSEIILHCFVSALFTVVAASYLYVLVWMILAGLKEHTDLILKYGPSPVHRFDYESLWITF